MTNLIVNGCQKIRQGLPPLGQTAGADLKLREDRDHSDQIADTHANQIVKPGGKDDQS